MFAPTTIGNPFAANGNSVVLGNLMILPGSQAPPSDRSFAIMRPFDEELRTVQRYFAKSFNYAVAPGASISGAIKRTIVASGATTMGGFGVGVEFPVPMRATPTMTIYNPNTGAVGSLQYWPTNIAATANVADAGEVGFGVHVTGASGLTVNAPYEVAFHYLANARL